jgi:chromosome segregation ATPase
MYRLDDTNTGRFPDYHKLPNIPPSPSLWKPQASPLPLSFGKAEMSPLPPTRAIRASIDSFKARKVKIQKKIDEIDEELDEIEYLVSIPPISGVYQMPAAEFELYKVELDQRFNELLDARKRLDDELGYMDMEIDDYASTIGEAHLHGGASTYITKPNEKQRDILQLIDFAMGQLTENIEAEKEARAEISRLLKIERELPQEINDLKTEISDLEKKLAFAKNQMKATVNRIASLNEQLEFFRNKK